MCRNTSYGGIIRNTLRYEQLNGYQVNNLWNQLKRQRCHIISKLCARSFVQCLRSVLFIRVFFGSIGAKISSLHGKQMGAFQRVK